MVSAPLIVIFTKKRAPAFGQIGRIVAFFGAFLQNFSSSFQVVNGESERGLARSPHTH